MENRTFIKIIGGMLLLCVVLTAFHGSEKRIQATIDDAFKYAIDQDFQNRKLYLTRKSANNIHFNVRDYALSPSFDQKISNYSIRTKDGVFTYHFKDSISEESAKRYLTQHILEQVQRIDPNQLKKLLQERLENKDIEAQVGVLYLQGMVRHWSEADSIVPKNAYSTPRQVLDISGRMKVQAWVDYSVGTILAHLDPVVYVILLLLIGVLMWVWPKRVPVEMNPEEVRNPEGMSIDLNMNKLVINGESCVIPKLDLAILALLFERQGECVTHDEIKQQFWPTEDNAREKIDTHIKTIRRILKDFPQYQIMNVRGKGYYLSMNDRCN